MVLFHDGLSSEHRAALARTCPTLRLEPVRPALRRRLAGLAGSPLAVQRRLSDFYVLEAFRIVGYRKVLYCDSDILFRGSVEDLFDSRDALVCCGDLVSVSGRRRDAGTFRPIDNPALAGSAGALERTFNSGFLLIDEGLTGERAYAELLDLVAPETWRGADTVHTDQLLLNRHFAGRQSLVSSTYNYPLHMTEAIAAREGLAPTDAKVLHFTGPVKPWLTAAMLRWTDGDPHCAPHPAHPAYVWWHEAWLECLKAANLREVARVLRGGKPP